jgi:hypothetical protein
MALTLWYNIPKGWCLLMEIWKPINGYEGWYEISSLGNVRSLDRKVDFEDGRYATYKGKPIKRVINSNGYYVTSIWKNSKSKIIYIHRLVADNFIPNPNNLNIVNHKDGNKLNNSIENLEWVSVIENVRHAQKTGLIPKTHVAKKVKQYDKEGNLVASFNSYYEAAKETGFNSSKIGLVVRGKRKTHKGFIWKEGD